MIYKGQGIADVKRIEVEGDKRKDVTVRHEMSPRNGKRGMVKILYGNGTRLSQIEKENKKIKGGR
jgi:hypothetical protein